MFFLIVNKPCNCGGTWSKLKKNPNLHKRLRIKVLTNGAIDI